MKSFYYSILMALLGLSSLVAKAQYAFTPSALGPYSQNFDAMSTGAVSFEANGTTTALPGIIVGYINSSGSFSAVPTLTPNNGSLSTSAPYNFGTSKATDRALGGIAGGPSGTSGIGYICVRLRNTSKVTIKNLDIRYAIEQWYNSTNSTDAYFRASYRTYSTTTAFTNNDIVADAGWTNVSALDLQAPATGGIMGQVDGNSTTYRRTAQARLTNINLANNTELVLRLKYIFNSATNGNGISVDDIVIYPETNVLYSTSDGDLSSTSSWGQSSDGSNPPASLNFAADNTTYYIQGSNAASRVGGNWRVTGTDSRVVIGTDAVPTTFYLASTDKLKATVDVASGSTLQIANSLTAANMALTLGSLAAGSTVQYVGTGPQNVLAGTYSNLTLGGTGSVKYPQGDVTVAKMLDLGQAVVLGSNNLTLLRGATLNRGAEGQVVATGTGSYRATVLGAGKAATLLPLALSPAANDYLPVTITSGSSDKDETYRAQVVENVYTTYSTAGTTPATYANAAGATKAPTNDNLNATWYIGHETATPVAATLKLGWVANNGTLTREGKRFATRRGQTYIDHYNASTNAWDASPANLGAFSENGLWAVQRTGVSSFSPFAITANSAGPLPVALTEFAARRVGGAVQCTWATASELHNDHFVVERSLDGQVFRPLGTVAGQGSTTAAHTYAFRDEEPASGRAYYRLQQVDADQASAYSPVVAVAEAGIEAGLAAVAFPNPSAAEFSVQTTFEVPTLVEATVVNALGQPVLQVAQQQPAGAASLLLDLRAQPAGVYLLQLHGPTSARTLRLLKQ